MPGLADHQRVLGVDPGTRVVGWGVVERAGTRMIAVGYGVLRVDPALPIEQRLARLAAGLRAVIATHAPLEAALEEVFYGRDASAAQRLGEGRGALLVALADAGLPVAHYANNVAKKALTGHGRASKQQVAAMLQRVLSLAAPPSPLDASDALALAICHHQRPALPAGGGVPARLAEAMRRARRQQGGGRTR
ncbi:MAG: crossover junction endodeoxyribonuclease RuvC [Planctomycetota bacterium]|nr:crossover junction endodeoxyribonuclease RuvC [Planctomycetota bacterium]